MSRSSGLGEPVGKQDQYIAAFGGLACFEFAEDGRVNVTPLAIPQSTLYNLEDRLMMFFTGYSRAASSILDDQRRAQASAADDDDADEPRLPRRSLGKRISDGSRGGTRVDPRCAHA